MTIPDLEYYEEVDEVHRDCLVRQAEQEGRSVTEKDDKGTCTDLTIPDLEYYEELDEVHRDCLVRQAEQEGRSVTEKDDKGTCTDLTIPDLEYYEEVDEVHRDCLVRLEEEGVRSSLFNFVEKEDKEVGTDLTIPDLEYLEEVETLHLGCLHEKEDAALKVTSLKSVDTEDKETATELLLLDLQYLEEAKAAHQECLETREEEKVLEQKPDSNVDRSNKSTMTEMTSMVLNYLEELQGVYKETVEQFEELKRSTSVEKNEKNEKNVMTQLTSSDLERFRVTHGNHGLEKFEEGLPGLFEQGTSTDLTLMDLRDLEDMADMARDGNGSSRRDFRDQVVEDVRAETMNDLRTELQTFPEFEIDEMDAVSLEFSGSDSEQLDKNVNYAGQLGGDAIQRDEIGTMTELTQEDLLCLEEEVERLHREEEPESSCVKGTMTDLTNANLEYLEELEILHKETEESRDVTRAPNMENAEVMTEMTTADLEYLEEAESVYRTLSENVDISRLLGQSGDKEDKEVITELAGSDIEYLEVLGEMYKEKQGDLRDGPRRDVGQEDKCTATELSLLDIGTLEDLANAEESQVPRRKRDDITDAFQQETVLDLQSELQGFAEFDDPARGVFNIEKGDQGVMTELTLSDLEYLEQRNSLNKASGLGTSSPQTDRLYCRTNADVEELVRSSTADSHDVSVQCELESVLSLMEELHQEAEGPGADMPAWYISALKIAREDGGRTK